MKSLLRATDVWKSRQLCGAVTVSGAVGGTVTVTVGGL
jgi:hypothetical protein